MLEVIAAVVDWSLDAIEPGVAPAEPIPRAAAMSARRAARANVNLGAIQRRYLAGHRELGEFVIREVDQLDLMSHGELLTYLRRRQEALLEQLAAAVEAEYRAECASWQDARRTEIVTSLLTGGPVDASALLALDYEIGDQWHLGMIASGSSTADIVTRVGLGNGYRCLGIALNNQVWLWLGTQEPVRATDDWMVAAREARLSFAIGEAGKGLDGWRLTHEQAKAAFAVALRRPERVARYADARLLAAALQDETLSRSLVQRYLLPLGAQSDGGVKLRTTLRAYIDLECNATSAAHSLNVGRHTVENRINAAEQLIGAPLHRCLAELDVALRLCELR